jgi:hypothetical protein
LFVAFRTEEEEKFILHNSSPKIATEVVPLVWRILPTREARSQTSIAEQVEGLSMGGVGTRACDHVYRP